MSSTRLAAIVLLLLLLWGTHQADAQVPCDPNPCQNGGTCMTDGSDSFTCGCIAGYTGDVCDIDIDDCVSNPCQNGNCIDGLNTFACMCTSGYTGGVCDININDCEPDPCLNGGTCIDEVDNFMCICISGFTGDTCDIEVLCSNPIDISNGTVMFTTTSVGDTATYSCDSGFELIGGATTTCTEVDANSAEFLPQPPVCKPLCSVPADISNGTVMFTTTSVGDTATYSCDSGFELIGGATTTCTEVDANSAEFLPQPPVCKPLCSVPADNSNGTVMFTTTSVGDTATYSCDSGFELIGGATTTCTEVNANSAEFLPQPPVCKPLCSVPADISNGTVMFTTTSIGDTATYSCDSGFELLGGATTTCTEVDANSAEFLPQPPVCKLPSSTVTSDVYFATTELTLTCAIKIALELGSVVLAPAAPVIMTPTPQTDSISITWSQAAEDVVQNYSISYVYSGTCPNVPVSSPVTLDSTATSYVVPDLEAFSMYTITVAAINPAGKADATVTATTLFTAPGAAPSSVTATVMDSATILVQWDEVPCLDQNSVIAGYTVQYQFRNQSNSLSTTGTDRMASLTSLQPFTNYSIQVAAVNSNNEMGPLSTPITEHTPAANVQFRFMNDEIVNHGIVTITDITESEPLLCVTDRIDCCPPGDSGVSNGQWYFPDESAVPEESEDNFYQTRAVAAVQLHGMNGTTNGIFRCDIPDTVGSVQTMHIGIYNINAGGVDIDDLQFTLMTRLTAETPVFTLTCTSTGGPATTVTWERNGVQLMDNSPYSISQVVENTVQAVYPNRLSVTGRLTGSYRCSVNNIRGSTFRVLDIQSTDPPTNVAAMQVGLTGFTVSWTPPNTTPTGYVVFFQGGDDEGSVMVDSGSATVVTVDGRLNNRQYSITMVALSLDLPSTVTSSETVMLFEPPTVAITPSPATAIAGESFTLTCTVILTMGVSGPPTIEWIDLNDTDTGITVGDVTADMGDASIYTRTLTFMLQTSHGGDYTCEATSSTVTGMDSETLTVQIPPPTLAFVRVPDTDVTLRHGDTLTLTCTIEFEPDDVDSVVTVDGELSGPGLSSVNTVTEVSPLMYELTGEVTGLQATTTPDTYTCTVTANPGSSEMNVIASAQETITEDVIVELLVSISVGRTDPPGFTPADSTEYRAASGPQVVTCTATGVSGSISYQWSSTCNGCVFSSSTAATISRTAVHSRDIGTHTCTATDTAGRTGSTGVVFSIVGSGIHVFNGAPPTGSQPNNGLVISNVVTSEFRFRFFCRSDSLTLNVGELIGLDDNVITTSTNFIGLETPTNGGELIMENIVGSQQALTAEQQGIYTCRIPLQNGTETVINIGVYPNGFATMPSITSLTFTQGSSSSTLTCTSTGSVATTVTFMRDGTTVGPLRDGELIELDGAIFQLTQTVTSRSLSTYASVLTITQDLSDVVGHIYTCTVTNVLGSSNPESLEVTGIQTVGGDQSLTVGEMNIITCSTSLDISDIVWIDDMDAVVASNSGGVQQLDLVFNPVNDSIHNRMYTCRITVVVNTNKSLVISETVTVQVRVPRPAITVSVISEGSDTAGESYALTCIVMEEIVGLTNMPSLQWLDPSDQVVADGEGITIGQIQRTDTTAMLVLTFDPVRTSHGGEYTCQGTLESPTGTLRNTSEQTVTVQIPPPILAVIRVPDTNVTLRHGDTLTLTCTIEFEPDNIDSVVTVDGELSGPGLASVNSVTKISPLMYQLTGEVTGLQATAAPDTYTCTVTANPGPLEMNLIASEQEAITVDITVELLVSISVDRTDPPGFTPGDSTEYRAASGPQVVTCTATGGTGSITYQWLSTCNDCVFSSSTDATICRAAVHSGDTDTHTCTATDTAGRTGSTSVVFTIVGSGIHVFNGAPPTGSQPNNGLVISNDVTSGYRFRFFCRSDSVMLNVGELIGLDDNAITTNTDSIGFEAPGNGGELRVESIVGSQQALTADQQGIYTCRIPLQNGTGTNINIGIYPSGFTIMPSITNPLIFTPGFSSSTLTCTSTGSVATTVTFMRDGTTVGPLRDGESMDFGGVTYQLVQTVTNRAESTYQNVLTVNQPLASIVGSSFTCSVENAIGTSPTSDSLRTMITPPSVVITPTSGTVTAGESFVFTCTVTLAEVDSGQATIAWTGPVDISTASDIMQGTTTQDLDNSFSFTRTLEFTTVLTSHAGDYTCEGSTSAGMDIEIATLTVEIPPPAVTVSGPNGLYFATTELTLTCTIDIASALSSVEVTAVWMGPEGTLSGIDPMTRGSNLRYESMLTIDSLPTTSSATYTCTATVDVMPTSEFITASMETGTLEIDIVLAPAAPVIMTPTPQTDSISITWSQAAEDVVQDYSISHVYSGTCPNVSVSSPVTLDSTATSYVVPDLEAFSIYTITVAAINPAGMTDATVTATTLFTAPGAAPSSVDATVMDSATILVQWDEVPCLDQNSNITSYTVVRYEFGDQSSSVSITVTDRMASLTSLQPFTNYSIQVAAVNNNDDMGPLSTPITEHTPATNVQFRFMNDEIVNHGIVTITGITVSEPLLCVTDRIDCCPPGDSGVSNGQWYFPDESAVPEESEDNFYQTRAVAAVRLHGMNGITSGIFHCDIPDTVGSVQTLHIGIYDINAGGVDIDDLQFTLMTRLTAETPVFTLTCISTGGPATTVTWERDGVQLMNDSPYSISQVVENTVQAVYSNRLSVTGRLTGSYRCSVNNIRGSTFRVLDIQSTDPPTNAAAMQVGLTSFKVSWTPPNTTPTGYVVFFQGGDDEGSVMVDSGSATKVTVDGRLNNRQYSVTMVALSLDLPSTVTSPETVMLFQPPTVAITPSPAIAIAGESFTLTCTVTLTTGVSGPPAIEWIGLDDNDPGITVGDVTTDMGDASIYTRTLTFMLRTSHGGVYTCEATSSAVTGMDSETLTVQIPPPILAFVRVPDTDVTLRHGDTLTLTCTIQFESDDVDSDVVMDGELSGPGLAAVNSVTEISHLMYQLTGEVTGLQATAAPDTYTCTVTANPGPLEMNLLASEQETITVDITVELLVSISVDRTDPPGFTPENPSEYRAASGPQVVTCTATGGTGSISYQWSSNCNDCAFSSSTGATIFRTAVHSGDTGTHTCTATDTAGRTGSTSVVFTIVGSGIHAFNGAPPTGSQPNNGLVISNDVTSGYRFRFFCRSDSVTFNVGELIGLDDNAITTNTNSIGFEAPGNGGELRMENIVGSQQALTAEQQGVYTCRIRLQNGTNTSINIGIYPSGFTTVPSITSLTFTPGTSSSTLTCTSTGSVATTVTFMRDGTTVGPLRDGELIELEGAIFQLTQTVTSRSLSTYASVLTISQDLSDVVGHIYTCTVTNVLGSSNPEPLEVIGIQTMGGDQSLTVGEMNIITCSTSLDISDIVWIDDMDAVVASSSEGVQQLDLVFNPVNDSIHNRMYTCRITAVAVDHDTNKNPVISKTITVQVRVPRPAITVSVISEGSDTAGESYFLTCIVMEEVVGLTNMPSLQWLNPSDQVVADGEGITIGQIQRTDTTAMLVLTFDPVRTSHGGEYTCQGTLESPTGTLRNTSEQTVTVQIPQPTLAIAPNLQPAYNGTNFSLTCIITLNDAVDSPVSVKGMWMKGSDILQTGGDSCIEVSDTTAVDSTYEVSLSFKPLGNETRDGGSYTCSATVEPQPGSTNAQYVRVNSGMRDFELLIDALPTPVVTFSGSPLAILNRMYTLTCSVEVVEGLTIPPVVTWMSADNTPVTGNIMEQETNGAITTRDLVFSSLSEADLREYVCEGCVTISKIFIDGHCGQTRPCITTEGPNIDTVSCTSTSDTELSVEWTEATATRDACDRDGGAEDITTYEVDVLQHVQNGNTISTVFFNEMEYPRDVDISQLKTSVTGLVPGVPYQVRVRAASLGGFGSPAIENCFSKQLEPPAVNGISVERVTTTAMIVFWTPLTLVQARGFVRYRVSYRPLNSQKRQEVSVVVSGDQGSVAISELFPGVSYDVVVVPFNTEPSGQELAGSPSSAVAPTISSPNNTVYIIGGVVVAVVLILAVTIIVIVCILVYVWHRNRRTELPIQKDLGSTKESTVAKLEDPEVQTLKNVAYPQLHHPRDNLPNLPFPIHPSTEAIPQEEVYEEIPGESQPLPQDTTYELMNLKEESLPPTSTDSQPEAAYEMVNVEDNNSENI